MSTFPVPEASAGQLAGRQRKYLRGLAHGLKPVVQIGRNGLTDAVFTAVDEALGRHELIKIRFFDLQDRKRETCAEITERTGGEQVGMIGHVAIFYRPAPDPENRRIVLPS